MSLGERSNHFPTPSQRGAAPPTLHPPCQRGDTDGMATDAPLAPTSRKPKRRWRQFSISSLLLLILVCAVGLGFWARQDRIRRNRLALIERRQSGGHPLRFEAAFRGRSGHSLHVLVFGDGRAWNNPWMQFYEPLDVCVANEYFEALCSESLQRAKGDGMELEDCNGTVVLTIGGADGQHFALSADRIASLPAEGTKRP